EGSQRTSSMRVKEGSSDYRYFPEPDLAPIEVSDAQLETWKSELPELPAQKRHRYENELGLSAYDTRVLTEDSSVAGYFESAINAGANPKAAANWITQDIAAYLNKQKLTISEIKLKPESLADVITRIENGKISNAQAKEKLVDLLNGLEPEKAFAGQELISDPAVLGQIIDEIIAANPQQVEQYRGGKTNLKGFFVGQVLKKTNKRAEPKLTNELVEKKLNGN
ncbi:MAG: Asp-tRNA(Asn)/Glu-tRNA(Gln) amidotransferase GatCAB subunit B, partial [Sphaerospermopsis kisseleviana]